MSINTPRRWGIITVTCPSCLTPNGVRIGIQSYDSMAMYECHNCACFSRISVKQEMIRIKANESIQRGVVVHGKG